MENLERKIGTLQSSYTRAINHQEGRVGSLFQAKFKVVEIVDIQQAVICFNYVHRNPIKAGMVKDIDSWMHSSFNEYYLLQEGVCNRKVAYHYLNVPGEKREMLAWSGVSCDEGKGF